MNKAVPITILTGFLGAGKTTLVNKIIEENKNLKFGLIINEFGEEGIDGSLVQTESEEEIIEISNGCLCCVARGDLLKSAENLLKAGNIDYILIECSGLAEPMPIAQTFMMDNLDGKVTLDSVVCVVDGVNHNQTKENFRIAIEQIVASDIIILNKLQDFTEVETQLIASKNQNEELQDQSNSKNNADHEIQNLKNTILEVNPYAYFLENYGELDTKLLLETGKWTYEKVVDQEDSKEIVEEMSAPREAGRRHFQTKVHAHCDDPNCDHEHLSSEALAKGDHHHHEHEEVDEIVFVTEKEVDLDKFQEFVLENFPKEIVRAKGFLKFSNQDYPTFLFQMVGAKKILMPFAPSKETFNAKKSRVVFIGKNLDQDKIFAEMNKTLV